VKVHADDITVEIDGIRIVEHATLVAPAGSMIGLIGPNGSGKTTLLKTLYRAVRPGMGTVRVGGDDLWELKTRESALRASVVLQDDSSEFAFTVRETVETGRVPHKRLFERGGDHDDQAVTHALETAGVLELADRLLGTLSGGERQRVFVARALAQNTPVMVLDEPTNHLDIAAQIELMELLSSLPLTVITALHDLNLAAAYCDELYVMEAGRVIAHGPTADVLTPATIGRVYGVAAHCDRNPLTGRTSITFGPRLPHPSTNTTRTQKVEL
jgi:iron complex transport system ATP-binding protein